MQKTKEKDFIEIDYIGRIKETSQIFDLTYEDIARKENIYNKNAKYGPRIICLGENQILQSLDKFLVGKEVGKTYILELKPEEAFGKKDFKLIKIVPASFLKEQKINPFPGLQINASGLLGTILSVSGGRTTIDFNHPLASKNLVYEIKINKIVEKDEEKLRSLLESILGLADNESKIKSDNNKATITLKPKIPTDAKEELKTKAKELIPNLEISFS